MTMDDRIVEAVARAICAGNPDDCVFGTAGTHEPAVCHTRRWETYKSAARAAITAYQAEAWQAVAWRFRYHDGNVWYFSQDPTYVREELASNVYVVEPLYTLPPAPKASP